VTYFHKRKKERKEKEEIDKGMGVKRKEERKEKKRKKKKKPLQNPKATLSFSHLLCLSPKRDFNPSLLPFTYLQP